MLKFFNRDLVSTWLLPIVSAVLGLSVITVIWLLPQVQEEGVWYDMSAQIEERLLQETQVDKDEETSIEGSSSLLAESEMSSDSSVQPMIPKHSNTASVQVELQAQPIEPKQQALIEEEQRNALPTISHQQDVQSSTPTSPVANGLINVNQATAGELTELPGIGPSKAKAIVQYREKYGPFQELEELLEVKGIGPKILEKMRSKMTLGF